MSHLLLSHLSKDNNCPELVQQLFREHAGQTEVIVTSRYVESALYQINLQTEDSKLSPRAIPQAIQASLF